jgi:hypothetical protein
VNVDEPVRDGLTEHETELDRVATSLRLPGEETRGTADEIPETAVVEEYVPPTTATVGGAATEPELEGVFADAESSPRTLSAEIGIRVIAALVAVAAWIVPGMGHVITKRWVRGFIFFLCAGGLAVTGLLLRGNVFPQHSSDPFGTLGFLADAGSGVFYFFAKFFEAAGPDVSRAAGDYGTRLIAAAGVVNMLGVFDAYEIAMGRRG